MMKHGRLSWRAACGYASLVLFSGPSCVPESTAGPAGDRPPALTTPPAADATREDPLQDVRARWEQNDPQRQARDFWQRVQQRYATLDRYSDQAQIQLSYQLTGNVMLEAMPMAVSFDRGLGEWACQAFRARILARSSRLAIKIHEAATNNLDGQVKVMPHRQTLHNLWQDDPVAKIYLSGATDLPLSDPAQTHLPLLAPQLNWLIAPATSAHGQRPADLRDATDERTDAASEAIQLAGWTWHQNRPCVRLAGRHAGFRLEYWVDIQRELVVRIVYPNAILSPTLEHSPEIRGLQICLDMGEIRIDRDALAPPRLPDLSSERTVRRFVKIPESFPSPWIGRPSPNLKAPDIQGLAWDLAAHRNRYVVGLFIPPSSASNLQQRLSQFVAQGHPGLPVTGIVVLDDWSPQPTADGAATGRPAPVVSADPTDPIVTILPYGAEAWAVLGLNPGSWLVIWDPQGVLQYVGPIATDELSPTIDTVLQRLAVGEKVGEDMVRDYQRFYDEYLQQLQQSMLLEQPNLSVHQAAQAN
jgi:hypothetical protein